MTATLIINDSTRKRAHEWLDVAPHGSVVTFSRPKRTLDQNAYLWALLTDLSRQKPQGIEHTPEMWKNLVMQACGHDVQFITGLDGNPFPVGFRSSKMKKDQMSELIEWILMWGAENGVKFSDEVR